MNSGLVLLFDFGSCSTVVVMMMGWCRFGRLTVVTLESKLEARDKEVQQLTRALEKSDEHISSLENELQLYRSQQQQQPATSTASSVSSDAVGIETASSSGGRHESTDDNMCSTADGAESCKKKLRFTSDTCS